MNSFYIVAPSNSMLRYKNLKRLRGEIKLQKASRELMLINAQEALEKSGKAFDNLRDLEDEREEVKASIRELGTELASLKNEDASSTSSPEALEVKRQMEAAEIEKEMLAKDISKTKQKHSKLVQKMHQINNNIPHDRIKTLDQEIEWSTLHMKENKTSNFTVRLAQTLLLTGEGWFVGLAQLTYPRSWNNLNEGPTDQSFNASYSSNLIEIQIKKTKLQSAFTCYARVSPGDYETPDEIIREFKSLEYVQFENGTWQPDLRTQVNIQSFEFNNIAQLAWNAAEERFTLNVSPMVESLILSDHMKYILGFPLHQDPFGGKTITMAKFTPDFRAGIDSLYIYLNIAEPTLIGDSRAPLLRTVGGTGRKGDIIDQTFDSPHYVPVAQKSFSSLQITIKSDQDQYVKFAYGKLIAKLHFKRIYM